MTPRTTSKVAATNAVTAGPNILRVLFVVLLVTVPLAWLGAWWNQQQDDRLGVPDVTIAAPDGKPVLSLDYDPDQTGRLLVSAGDKTPGGGVVLWESTDKADSELPMRDAGAFGRVHVQRNRTFRSYGKEGGGVARFSPDGKYIATWSGKLTLWLNKGYHSVPLRSVEKTLPFYHWDNSTGRTTLVYERGATEGGEFALLPKTRKTTPHQSIPRSVSAHATPFAENGNLLVGGDNRAPGTLYFHNRRTGNLEVNRKIGTATLLVIAFAADGKQLAVGDAHGWVYRFERNVDGKYIPAQKLPRFAHAQNPGPDAPKVTALAFSHDGKTLATGGTDGAVFLWRL